MERNILSLAESTTITPHVMLRTAEIRQQHHAALEIVDTLP